MTPYYQQPVTIQMTNNNGDRWQFMADTVAMQVNSWTDASYGTVGTMNTTDWYSNAATTTGDITYTFDMMAQQANVVAQNLKAYGNRIAKYADTKARKRKQPAAAPPPRPIAPPGFNKYVNASDLLEEFIAYLATQGVRQRDFMNLPVELFIKWLIVRACEEDGEAPPDVSLELPPRPSQPRCFGCNRFMARSVVVPLHDDVCAQRYFARQLAA